MDRITKQIKQAKDHILLKPTKGFLSPLAPNPASKLDVLGHYGDPLGMNSAEVGVLKQTDQVRLRRLLERRHRAALEPQISLEVLCDLPHKSLERKLADQELSALLVLPDFPQRHSSRPETVGLLHSTGRRSRLPSSLSCQLLPWSLSSGGLASSLLGTSHLEK
ncbi:hypothetical protein DVH24_041965 [Malus domestica]|uniref:Uncharacterized protein n=1 Tax=Malus domestica TaxID=3750 RepID=A0A498ISW6_MALDO|nr:hypothetical protein DVH24_041965 [Malus domestica]